MENVGGKIRDQVMNIVAKVASVVEGPSFVNDQVPQNMCVHLMSPPAQEEVCFCILYWNVGNL